MTIDPGGAKIRCLRTGWKELVFVMDAQLG
jgi:hypothetical protein